MQAKIVLLKNLFSRRYSQNNSTLRRLTLQGVQLGAVLACAEPEILIFVNPKLANTAWSRTWRRLRLHKVKQIC